MGLRTSCHTPDVLNCFYDRNYFGIGHDFSSCPLKSCIFTTRYNTYVNNKMSFPKEFRGPLFQFGSMELKNFQFGNCCIYTSVNSLPRWRSKALKASCDFLPRLCIHTWARNCLMLRRQREPIQSADKHL